MADDASASTCQQRGEEAPLAGPTRTPFPVRILLVEDDDVDAKLIGLHAAAIEGMEVVIERAVSTEDAQGLLAAQDYDLCILDYWLGCESVLRLLTSAIGRCAGPPAVVLTSLSTPEIRQMCRQAGAVRFLGKDGISSDALRSAIIDALQRTAARPSSPLGGDAALTRLVALLAEVIGAAGGALSPTGSAAAERFRERSRIRDQLSLLDEVSETVRFGLFEQALAALRRRTPEEAHVRGNSLARVTAGAIEIAHGLLDSRGQTMTFQLPELPTTVRCDPAALFFLIFELVSRASEQSASDSHIRASLRVENGALCVSFSSAVPTDANAGAVAFGPLFTQILRNYDGTVSNVAGPHGGLVLRACFEVPAPASAGPFSLH